MFARTAAVAALILAAGFMTVRADDPDQVKIKLDDARKTYEDGMKKFRSDVVSHLQKAEDDARSIGKEKVDQIKAERDLFEKKGILPTSLRSEIKNRAVALRSNMGVAYTKAIKEYTRLKDDDAAAGVEKEYDSFKENVPFGLGPDTRKFWMGNTTAFKQDTGKDWRQYGVKQENVGKAFAKMVETKRTTEYVELQQNGSPNNVFRLYNDKYSRQANGAWQDRVENGKWK